MSVRNPNKADPSQKLPKRKFWLGACADHVLPQLPLGPRGVRRSSNTEDYQKNKKTRAQQRCPADKSKPYRKGPSKRAPGTSREAWIALCTGGR